LRERDRAARAPKFVDQFKRLEGLQKLRHQIREDETTAKMFDLEKIRVEG